MRMLFFTLSCLVLGVLPSFAVFPGSPQNRGNLSIFNLPPFERAVRCIKFYEGWHTEKHYPYIGYGHKIQPHEKLDHTITEKQADSLLRSDLLYLCSLFRSYGIDSLLLSTLAYNIGPYKLLGNSQYPKSTLLKKQEAGNRDIYEDYISYCHWKGKYIASIRRRRIAEFRLLFLY